MSADSTAQLRALPGRAEFARLLEESTRAGTRYSDVTSAAGRLFYRRLTPGDRVPSLVVRDGAPERVLVDPTAGSTEVAAISNYTVSPDGSLVAVHVAKGGGEVGEMRFIDVATGRQRGSALGPIWGEFAVSWIGPDLVSYTRITASGPGADLMQDMQTLLVTPGEAGPGRPVLGRGVAGSPAMWRRSFRCCFGRAPAGSCSPSAQGPAPTCASGPRRGGGGRHTWPGASSRATKTR
jgi:prolyl oligopeptidase